MQNISTIREIFCGIKKFLLKTDLKSSIDKQRRNGKVFLSKNGLSGDTISDLQHHGGLDRAVHMYPYEHYKFWRNFTASHGSIYKYPMFGENLSTIGLTEDSIHIGDILRVGETVLLQVTQPRKPCWKLDIFNSSTEIAKSMQDSLRTGWFCSVLNEGYICAHDEIKLIKRFNNELNLSQVLTGLFLDPLNTKLLKKFITSKYLSDNCKCIALKRLDTKTVENWQSRLQK